MTPDRRKTPAELAASPRLSAEQETRLRGITSQGDSHDDMRLVSFSRFKRELDATLARKGHSDGDLAQAILALL